MSISGVVEAIITGCCSKRSTGGRQGGHSRLYIRSIAARVMIGRWMCVDGVVWIHTGGKKEEKPFSAAKISVAVGAKKERKRSEKERWSLKTKEKTKKKKETV